MVLIFVKTKEGRSFPVDVQTSDKVSETKAKIARTEEVSASRIVLLHAGKKLSDTSTLQSCGIEEESTVHMLIQQTKKKSKSSSYSSSSSESESYSKSKSSRSSSSTSSSSSSSSSGVTEQQAPIPSEKETREALISNFASASGSKIEVVFVFDTTGSMASCLRQVRTQVQETVSRLIKDIPNIRIGIIAMGDYCDYNNYVTKELDLTNDVKRICQFVNTVKSTGGGDAPEAYEWALHRARSLSWTEGYSKALVMIGDCEPHPPCYTSEKIHWHDELDALVEAGVKVYAVQAMNNDARFYKELARASGALHIKFSQFRLMTDMFLAVCYRESSPEQLQNYADEVAEKGEMKGELEDIFEELAKPNPIAKTEVDKKNMWWETSEWDRQRAWNTSYFYDGQKWMIKSPSTSSRYSSATKKYSSSSSSSPSYSLPSSYTPISTTPSPSSKEISPRSKSRWSAFLAKLF